MGLASPIPRGYGSVLVVAISLSVIWTGCTVCALELNQMPQQVGKHLEDAVRRRSARLSKQQVLENHEKYREKIRSHSNTMTAQPKEEALRSDLPPKNSAPTEKSTPKIPQRTDTVEEVKVTSTGAQNKRSSASSLPFVNIARHGKVVMSSSKEDCEGEKAVDGYTRGFYEECHSSIQTQKEKNPYWEVSFGSDRHIDGVDVWVPLRGCDEYRKKQIACTDDTLDISRSTPLVISFLNGKGSEVLSKSFSNPQGLYVLAHLGIKASTVRVSLQTSSGVLYLAEVQVFGEDPEYSCEKYCYHGACRIEGGEEVCKCDADFIGPECDTNSAVVWRYLPNNVDHAVEKRSTFETTWFGDTDYQSMMSKLTRSQSRAGANCNDENAISCNLIMQSGLGSTFHHIQGMLTAAFVNNKAMVLNMMHEPWLYANSDYCRNRSESFDCYFEKLTTCPTAYSKDLTPTCCFCEDLQPLNDVKPVPEGIRKRSLKTKHFLDMVPQEVEDRGRLWWRSLQTAYMSRMSPETQKLVNIESLKKEIGYEHPIIGVHVRHGDACTVTRRKGRCLDFQSYIPEIEAMSQKYGVKNVFLATDDSKVIAEASAFTGDINFVYLTHQSVYEKKANRFIEQRLSNGVVPAHDAVTGTLIDLELLADSDYIIGSFESNMSRQAFELAVTRHKRVPPFVSMDGSWCPYWTMCCDVSDDGVAQMC